MSNFPVDISWLDERHHDTIVFIVETMSQSRITCRSVWLFSFFHSSHLSQFFIIILFGKVLIEQLLWRHWFLDYTGVEIRLLERRLLSGFLGFGVMCVNQFEIKKDTATIDRIRGLRSGYKNLTSSEKETKTKQNKSNEKITRGINKVLPDNIRTLFCCCRWIGKKEI